MLALGAYLKTKKVKKKKKNLSSKIHKNHKISSKNIHLENLSLPFAKISDLDAYKKFFPQDWGLGTYSDWMLN